MNTPPADPELPRLEPPYVVVKEIGRGGMATVYLAHDQTNNPPVAAKVVRGAVALALGPERFIREIRIASRLEHPNILPLLTSGLARLADGATVPYYLTPYCPGGTLRDRLSAEGPLPIETVIDIARQLARALEAAHAHRVVHRDLKPDNIFFDGSRVLVGDFGIARIVGETGASRLSSSGLIIGTPSYMSPEQATGTRVDERSDLYALGCVLYEMLSGAPPFAGPTPQAIVARHQHEVPPPLAVVRPGVPEPLLALLARLLAKVPADRPQTAAEVLAALDGSAPGERRFRVPARWVLLGAGLATAVVAWSLRPRSAPQAVAGRVLVLALGGTGSRAEADAGWRQALARWSGFEFVGDEGGPANLAEARSRARAIGAGRIVAASLTDSPTETVVTAELVDAGEPATSGRRATVRGRGGASLDSLFSNLADSLVVPPRARDSTGSGLGTVSLPALEAFSAGLLAVDRWNLVAADSAFATATRADGRFRRGLLWLALTRMWQDQPSTSWRYAVDRALASAGPLGAADERRLQALRALADGDHAASCPLWGRLAQAAARDFVAWYGWAKCLGDDRAVIRDRTSPSGWRFRSSYHYAIDAYRRAFALLPAIHTALSGSAFRPLREMLLVAESDSREGVAVPPDSGYFAAYPGLAGDTIVLVPYPSADFFRARSGVTPASHGAAVKRQRGVFLDIAGAWAAADATSADAALAFALALEANRDPGAATAFDRATALARTAPEASRVGAAAVWSALRTAVPNDPPGVQNALRRAETLLARYAADTTADPVAVLSMAVLAGRTHLATALAGRPNVRRALSFPAEPGPDGLPLLVYAALGGPAESLRVVAARVEAAIAAASAAEPSLGLATRMESVGRPASLAFPEVTLPALRHLAGRGDYLIDAQAALLAGDSSGAATALRAVVRQRSAPPAERPLDAVFSEARLMAEAGHPGEALAWLEPVLGSLALAPAGVFADPARAGVLRRAVSLTASLATRTGNVDLARRYQAIADALAPGAPPR